MKLLIPIDQRGSLAAGIEAPNSWEPFNLPVIAIPPAIRQFIAEQYNPATYKLADPAKRVLLPLNEEKVIAWLKLYHRDHIHRAEKERAEKEETERKTREAALEVLQTRRTQPLFAHVYVKEAGHQVQYTYDAPAWPFSTPADILQSDDAVAWQVETEAGKQRAEEEAVRRTIASVREREQREEATKKWIADWVGLYGTNSQKERLAAGLLPQSEVIDEVLKQVAPFPKANLTGSQVEEISEVPPQAWNVWKTVKERAPHLTAKQFLLIGPKQYAVIVTTIFGPMEVETTILL